MARLRRNEWNFAHNAAVIISETLQTDDFASSVMGHAEPELGEYRGARRLDLVVFSRITADDPLVTGELKVPWDQQGRTPFNTDVVEGAHAKASGVGARYFITWNVRRVVVWKTDDPGVPLSQRVVYDDEVVSLPLRGPADLSRPGFNDQLREGIGRLLTFLQTLLTGPPAPAFLPLDRVFVANIEAALDHPILCVEDAIRESYRSDSTFKRRLEKWMRDGQQWVVTPQTIDENISRAARFTCYVLVNRLCFYNALRRKYGSLSRLTVPNNISTGRQLQTRLGEAFADAKRYTGDYETVFDGDVGDTLPFLADEAVSEWRRLVRMLDRYDFAQIDIDVIGAMYERLIRPEERHRYGQHYTQPAVVDLINAYSIARGNAQVLDPGCGGGTFLVRAYARKRALSPAADHSTLLAELYGCDILNYACHLTTVNLAVRDLIDDDNFPRVRLGDFLRFQPGATFVKHPVRIQAGGLVTETRDIVLAERSCDAVVGNPPYIEAKELPERDRTFYFESAQAKWPQFPWRKASDILVYFWLHAAELLRDGGVLALLTQEAWLDVDYGVPLQRWMLANFRILAVIDSEVEPWFTDARVATAVTILQKETDPDSRDNNVVRFVQFRVRLADVIGQARTDAERQQAAESLRDRIMGTTQDVEGSEFRLRLVRQDELGSEGLDADGHVIGSKWGRYLRYTATAFRLMREHRDRYARLADLAAVDRGITTNCDSFFIVEDVTPEYMNLSKKAFKERFGVTKDSAVSRHVAIIKRRDDVEFAIERECLRPILKTARDVERFATSRVGGGMFAVYLPEDRDSLTALQKQYIEAGERERWHRTPSFRAMIEAGRPWYVLRDSDIAPILFVKTIQYTPLVLLNDARLVANQRLYKVQPKAGIDAKALCAVLNSTVFACDRYAAAKALGRELAIDIEVFTARAMMVADLRLADADCIAQLGEAMDELCGREAGAMLESQMEHLGYPAAQAYAEQTPVSPSVWPPELQCPARHRIDELVLGLVGVPPDQVAAVRTSLYNDLVGYLRKAKVLELEAQLNRQGSTSDSVQSPLQIADEIWASLIADGLAAVRLIPDDFIPTGEATDAIELPIANTVAKLGPSLFGDGYQVRFGRRTLDFAAEYIADYATVLGASGVSGHVAIPRSQERCIEVTTAIAAYLSQTESLFKERAAEVTSDESQRSRIVEDRLKRIVHHD